MLALTKMQSYVRIELHDHCKQNAVFLSSLCIEVERLCVYRLACRLADELLLRMMRNRYSLDYKDIVTRVAVWQNDLPWKVVLWRSVRHACLDA